MTLKEADEIISGRAQFNPSKHTLHDAMMLVAGGVVDQQGNITCVWCGKPNECCECGREKELSR